MTKSSKYLPILAASVASGMTIRSAAQAAKCSESNAYTISRTPEFRQRVSEIKTEAVERAVCRLTENAVTAADTLIRLMTSEDEKVALASATKLLAMLQPLSELAELRARIDSIENRTQLKVAQ